MSQDKDQQIQELQARIAHLEASLEGITSQMESDIRHLTTTGQKVGMPKLVNNFSEFKRTAAFLRNVLNNKDNYCSHIMKIIDAAIKLEFWGFPDSNNKNYDNAGYEYLRLMDEVQQFKNGQYGK